MRWWCLAAGALLCAAQQTEEVRVSAHTYVPPSLRITAQAQLVPLEVVVRDARGHAVNGLTRDAFEILDEGKPRAISAFSIETHAPAPAAPSAAATPSAPANSAPSSANQRSVLLFFDDLHTATGELQRTQAAARHFVTEGLGPNTRAAVFASSAGLTLDFTADPAALAAAIDKLRAHPRMSEAGLAPCPRIPPYQAYLIANNLDFAAFNAAVLEARSCSNAAPPVTTAMPTRGRSPNIPTNPTAALVVSQAEQTWQQTRSISLDSFDALENAMRQLERVPGTRVLLLVSSGFLSGMLETARDAAIDRAIRAGIAINALDAKGAWTEAPARPFGENPESPALPTPTFSFETSYAATRNDALNAVMADLASATGGLFFHNSNDLAGAFGLLGAAPETTYLLAFRPEPEGGDGKYHKLKVRLTTGSAGRHVQTRPGYFAPSAAENAPSTAVPRRLDTEALATDTLSEIPVMLAGRIGKTPKGDPELSLVIHVDLAKLPFAQHDGRHVQKLSFVGLLSDVRGNLFAAKEGAMDLALKDDTFARLTASGVNATLALSALPGPCIVRVVVQEAGGRMAALRQVVQIPK